MDELLMTVCHELRIMTNPILYNQVQRETILVIANIYIVLNISQTLSSFFVLSHLILQVKRVYDYSHFIEEKIKSQRD